jgi:glycosyltransferase involved in cell wall biosynthesis
MKILYLCADAGIPVLGYKGSSVHVRELMAAFARAGHQVILAAPLLNKSPWEKPQSIAGTLLHLRLSGGAQSTVLAAKEFTETIGVQSTLSSELRRILYNRELESELGRRFDSDPPDFIYERASLYGTAGAALARSFKVPLVIELNAPLALEQATYRGAGCNELARQAELWTLTAADALIAVSTAVRDHALSLGIDPQKLHVCPNGVNPASFSPGPPDRDLRARLALNDGPVVGFVGGLRPWHGVEVLPELLARLAQKYPDVRLLVAGDGQLRPQLEQRLRERGLASRVVFTGPVAHEEMPAIIRQFDVALAPYPALDHAFYFSPLKLFEYMACGVAVVAANCGQISEIVRPGENGLLYQPADIDGLASACERLLSNPKLRFALGHAAAQTIRDHYTWDQNARRVLDLANSLIAAKKSAS